MTVTFWAGLGSLHTLEWLVRYFVIEKAEHDYLNLMVYDLSSKVTG